MFLYDNIYILLLPPFVMKRITISLKIDPVIWKEAKKKSIDKDITYSEYVEGLISKDLKEK